MSTFQAVVYALVHGLTDFLPISSSAHSALLPLFLEWPEPSAHLVGAISAGSLLAILIFFRHDWASMISCFLQVLIYRKKPMTLDERLPIFLFASFAPIAVIAYYFKTILKYNFTLQLSWTPLAIAVSLVAWSVVFWASTYFGRKTKGMFDWNWFDSLVVGICQATLLITGSGHTDGALTGALFRNYSREAAVKFTLFASAPILTANTLLNLRGLDFHSPFPGGPGSSDLSWLSFGVAIAVSLFSSLLVIGGFMKQIQRMKLGQFFVYRCFLAGLVALGFWYQNRG